MDANPALSTFLIRVFMSIELQQEGSSEMDASRFSFLTGAHRAQSLPSAGAPKREYPTVADAYELLEEVGRGVSATVWRAAVRNTGDVVAVKKLDLENMNCSLDEIVREAQTMRSLNHPNLLPLHCSFVHDHNLWMVMPFIEGGSVLNIMRYKFPDGLEEPSIATIMKEVLKALEYLHRNGIIHRDVKAGNILLETNGHVMLADFGVAAALERGGSWGNRMISRNTFVGTPCWMAPEVMQQEGGYDSRADIWSFGITLLELAHGHAPFARLPPMKVLIMTLQNPPPTLDQTESKKHFSKAMRDIVAKCLVKDPRERPTAAQLLEHKFFKTAHDARYLCGHVLQGLPSVAERVEEMRAAHAGAPPQQAQQEREILASQQEYRRGVSSWNFDVAALKAAAAASAAEQLTSITESAELGSSMDPLSQHPSEAENSGLGPSGESGNLSPTKMASPRMGGATPGRPLPGGGRPGIKEHGRFKVYEGGDEPPPFSPPNGQGAALMEEAMAARSRATTPGPGPAPAAAADDFDGEGGDKAKRKGRFRYVEDDGVEGKSRISKAASQANIGDTRSGSLAQMVGSGVPGPPPLTVLLNPLKEMMERATQQHEMLREMVAAVLDADKGKQGALNAFLQQRAQLRGQSEVEQLRVEVTELREENARLRERLKEGGSRPGTAGRHTTSADELAS